MPLQIISTKTGNGISDALTDVIAYPELQDLHVNIVKDGSEVEQRLVLLLKINMKNI